MPKRVEHNVYEYFFGSKKNETGEDILLHWSSGVEYVIKKNKPIYLPKQIEAWHAAKNPETEILFMGGALGGSKSHGGRSIIAERLIDMGRRRGKGMVPDQPVEGAIFSENYPALMNRHGEAIQSWPKWLGKYYKSDKVFRFKDEFGGPVLKLLNLDKPEKYASAQFAIGFIDESTFNTEKTFNDIHSRIRWPGIKDTILLAASNPGRLGHSYHKRRFVDPITRDSGVVFIPSLLRDNPFLNLDPKYRKVLERLPPKIRKAWLEGSWDQFEGQYFPDLNSDIHLIPASFPIPPEWVHLRIIDWGFQHPAACLWVALDPKGNMYCYRTYEALQTPPAIVKKHIYDLSVDARTGKRERIDMTIADPSLKRQDGTAGNKTVFEIFNDSNDDIGSFYLVDAMRERIDGWQALQQAFHYEIDSDASEAEEKTVFKTYPQIKILDAQTHVSRMGMQSLHIGNALWDELNGLVYDEKKIEDAAKPVGIYEVGEGDDLAECLRYGWVMAGKTEITKSGFARNNDPMRQTNHGLITNISDDIKQRIARGTYF